MSWSQAEDRKLARQWLAFDPPRTVREIADDLDRSKSTVHRRIKDLGLRGEKGNRKKFEEMMGVSLDPVIRPVRVETDAEPTGTVRKADYTVLVWGDLHYPFADQQAVSILKQVARDVSPEVLINLGDTFDFFSISDYRPPKSEKKDLQRTVTEGTRHLAEMLEIAQPDRAVFLAGNHEDRWERLLLKAREDTRMRQLLKLPKIRDSLQFEEVIGFDELGYEYYPYQEGGNLILEDQLLITHGEFANKYAARKHLDIYGMNVMFGHTHKIQVFTRRTVRGQTAGFNIGCLCDLDPHYDETVASWHQGFALVHFSQVDGRAIFDVQQVRIHDGVAVIGEEVYRA